MRVGRTSMNGPAFLVKLPTLTYNTFILASPGYATGFTALNQIRLAIYHPAWLGICSHVSRPPPFPPLSEHGKVI